MASKTLTDADITAYEELSDYLETLQRQIIAAAEYDQADKYLDTCNDKWEDLTTPVDQATFYADESYVARFTGGRPRSSYYSKPLSECDQAWCTIEKVADEALAALANSLNEGFSGFTEDNKARLRRTRHSLQRIKVQIHLVFHKPEDM